MKRFRNAFASTVAIGLMIFGIAGAADAQRRNEREVRDLVRSLNAQVDDFQYGLDYELKNNSSGRANSADVSRSLRNLLEKVTAFENNFAAKRENRDDVNDIVTAAKDVDAAIATLNLNRRLQTDWADVKKSIDSLAANYGVSPDWSGRVSSVPMSSPPARSAYNSGLTGTYELDSVRSENISDIVSGSGASGANQQDLESKLEAPAQIALDIRGNQVTLATTKASPVSVTADGREKVERTNGRTIRLKATLNGQTLTVASLGGDNDYTITFVSMDNGQTLKVTRRITTDYLSETVFAESFYSKTDAIARLGIDNGPADTYSSNDPNDGRNLPSPTIGQGRTGEFVVPNGSSITALLETTIDTSVSQNNDRFKMTVQSPDEFRGAVIEGYLSGVGRSGRVSGRSNVTFNFESITLRNGQRYDFAGSLQSVKDQYGKTVKVDTEGVAKGESQTKETAKRGGIGAGAGAIIGAIIGGVKGAAIGAVIGGGAGAGSVVAQGRDDVKLAQGSTMTIQASSPIRGSERVSEN